MGQTNTFSFLKTSANDQTPERTLHIAHYELGRLSENYIKELVYGSPQGYLGNQQHEMGDIISMLRMFAEQRSWDFDAIVKTGEEHYLERQADIKARAKKQP